MFLGNVVLGALGKVLLLIYYNNYNYFLSHVFLIPSCIVFSWRGVERERERERGRACALARVLQSSHDESMIVSNSSRDLDTGSGYGQAPCLLSAQQAIQNNIYFKDKLSYKFVWQKTVFVLWSFHAVQIFKNLIFIINKA